MPLGVSSAAATKRACTRSCDESACVQEADAPTTDLFGAWQTRELVLPVAENGIVPKNDRGNVEAPPFAKALPGGTTHVDVPRAFAACRRLGVDHAPALVGFEASRGGMLPKISGVVVCSEHADAVRASALEDEAARQAKAREKRCGFSAVDVLGPSFA